MYYFPHSSEVLFGSSHWRIDGIGSLHLLNKFLEILAHLRRIALGDEGRNLCIGLDEAAGASLELTSEITQSATDLFMRLVDNVPSIGLPTSPHQIPGGTARCETTFTRPLTSSIVGRCKASGFSVTAATHAAIVSATSQLADPGNSATNYTSFALFDPRKYCRPPYNSAKNAVLNFHTGVPAVINPSSFEENVAQLQKVYSRRFDTSGSENIFSVRAYYMDKSCTLFTQAPPSGSLPPSKPP